MADFALTPAPALGGYEARFEGAELREVEGLAIVAVAAPLGGEGALEAALSSWGAAAPAPGRYATAADGARLVWTARDQIFALFEHPAPDAEAAVSARLGGAAYVTDQTDGWAALRLDGPAARPALERICPLDLHPDAFPEDAAARTIMEHLAAIILREGPDRFLLLTPRSSARSFLHAVETSLRNVA